MQTILNNWRLFAFIGGITLSGLIGVQQGMNIVQNRWTASIVTLEKATIEKEHNINTASNIIDRDLQDAQNNFDIDYNDFINGLYATSANLPKDNTTSKHNATACGKRLSKTDKAFIARLANEADKCVVQVDACIKFIKEVTQ